jgi:hypothetical protein
MEKIRILVYSDSDDFRPNPASVDGGLADLERFTKEKTKHVADVTFTFLQRHGRDESGREVNGENKLSLELLNQYEEVWFFGVRQIDTGAEPNNELKQEEVDALREWMQTGGVFLTGDHSSPDPTDPASDCHEIGHASFLGLGRALGGKIPRARHLRIWKGPPTGCLEGELNELDNFNTQDGFEPCLLDDPLLQADEISQTLDLVRKMCFPHRLFWYEDENEDVIEIRKFPDHWHEGEVVVPASLDSDWPEHSPPPLVVAKGQDKRFPNTSNLRGVIVAYDGFEDLECPKLSAGRIVADSSFHHYLDRNLKRLRSRDAAGLPIVGSDLDQIAHFYGNLALWLAPKAVRQKLKTDLLLRVANHLDVLEVLGNSTELVGKTASAVLNASLGPAKLRTFLEHSTFEKSDFSDEVFSLIFLGSSSRLPVAFERPDFFLGKAIELCHESFRAHGASFMFFQDGKVLSEMQQNLSEMVTSQLRGLGDMLVGR